MDYVHPEYLISAEELNARRSDSNVRVFDTAVFLEPGESGYTVTSGYANYEKEHIPGAGFIDLVDGWADNTSDLNFTLPTVDALAHAVGDSGIANTTEVVLYSSGHLMWATRAWWLLHFLGHERAAVLNGNLTAWREAGLPLEGGVTRFPPEQFVPAAQPARIADTHDVEAGMHGKVCTINALSRSLYEGTGDFYYKRRGHIPGSRLLYYDAVLDQEHFLPADQLSHVLDQQGMLSADQVITYCGGGIAATVDAFACKLLGQENVAVYDGSMSAWVQDDSRPLTTGAEP